MKPGPKKIGDREFVFEKLSVFDAIDAEVFLVKAVGEPIAAALAAGSRVEGSAIAARAEEAVRDQAIASDQTPPEDGAVGKYLAKLGMDEAKMISVFMRGIASNLNAAEVKTFMKTMWKSVSISGGPVDELTFGGDDRSHREPWEVVIHAIRVNFGDFLPAGLFASLPAATQK